ncbi:hypothetical protein [Aureivirga marina]|uniref:hypothetical protein n=1 Tax=Aureivirga marina TaxID=1182451 RepID=UPI0018CBEF06|nr:hypothetical protein [Aureivirga marina]
MGLNIKVFSLSNINYDENSDRNFISNKNVKAFENFDSSKKSGDEDFIFSEAIFWDEVIHEEDLEEDEFLLEVIYQRPEDILEAKEWIQKNIQKEHQKRLLDLMDYLEKDESLYLLAV